VSVGSVRQRRKQISQNWQLFNVARNAPWAYCEFARLEIELRHEGVLSERAT